MIDDKIKVNSFIGRYYVKESKFYYVERVRTERSYNIDYPFLVGIKLDWML